MPNCSCIRLSTLQSQHQTYRHSSTNQTLATFTFNILTFISTIYISLQTTSQRRQQPPTKLCRHFADPLSTLHWHCCSLFLVTMPCLSNFLTLCLQSRGWRRTWPSRVSPWHGGWAGRARFTDNSTVSQHRQQPPTKLCRNFADPLSTLTLLFIILSDNALFV